MSEKKISLDDRRLLIGIIAKRMPDGAAVEFEDVGFFVERAARNRKDFTVLTLLLQSYESDLHDRGGER